MAATGLGRVKTLRWEGPELREEEPRSIDGANDACSIVRDAKGEALGNLSLLY